MSYNNSYNNNSNNIGNTESEIQFNKIFAKAFYHWPLYVLTTFIALAGAWLYLRYSKPVFVSTAKIYIKDENKAGSTHSNALDAFALLDGSKLVENEMEIIRSPLILQDVILNNRFNIRFFEKGPVSEFEVYEKRAVEIKILSDTAEVGNYFFDITRLNDREIEVEYTSDLQRKKKKFSTQFNQPFSLGKDKFMFTYDVRKNEKNITGFQIKVDSIAELAYAKATQLRTTLVNNKASVFLMSYEDAIARRSADFLNAVAKRYNEYTLEDKNRTALTSIKFIDTRLQSLGTELGSIERDVETFKTTRGITQIDESSRLFLEQVKEADQKLDAANIQLSVYDQIEKYINNPGDGAFTPVIGNVDAALTGVVNRYQELLSQRKRLSLSLQPGNPLLENVEQQIADTKNTIRRYIGGYRQSAATQKRGLQRQVNQIEGQIAQVPKYEREFINLKRQQSVKESLYLFLLQKREETSVSYASNIVENKIISPAYIPRDPVRPQRMVVVIGFILVGLVLASLYILIKYLINTRVNSKRDIEKVIDVPVVAEIFRQEQQKGGKFFDSDQRSVLNEQVLNLRSNLMFLLNGIQTSPVILFTSSISGEGKTFLSAHLGKSLTSNRKSVLLMELDLRKPKLAKSLGISNNSGLTNYLVGTETLDEVIKKVSGADNLYLIPSGPIPPNPIELIEGERMKELFVILKQRFDYVIIDTAPFGLVSDAKSLAPQVDCALFVVRFNYTPKAKLREVASNMETTAFKRMGLIFNGIEQGSSYGYYSYGYSNYGYGYGYFGNENKNKIGSFIRQLKQRVV